MDNKKKIINIKNLSSDQINNINKLESFKLSLQILLNFDII